MIRDLPYYMLEALIITIIVEVTLALILKVRKKKEIINVILVNTLTNPILNSLQVLMNFYYGITARNITLLVLEILAFLVEGIIYKKTNVSKHPFYLSLILNISSYLIGLLINCL